MALAVSWNDNGKTKRIFVLDTEDGKELLDSIYAAAGEVHIPIGPGAYDAQFEVTDLEDVAKQL